MFCYEGLFDVHTNSAHAYTDIICCVVYEYNYDACDILYIYINSYVASFLLAP